MKDLKQKVTYDTKTKGANNLKNSFRKRIFKKVVTFIVVFAMFLSLIIPTYAEESTGYTSCRDRFFRELKEYVPENIMNSCSYVAMSMLLSYYDTCWNDNFVADEYEKTIDMAGGGQANTSPINLENQIINENMTDESYISFVEEHQGDGYLHIDLIGMGIDAGYYDGLFQDDEYGATIYETAHLLDEYFDGIFGEYNYYDYFGLNETIEETPPIIIKVMESDGTQSSVNEIKSKIYELLDDDVLVMYAGEDNDGERHRMIIFETIEEDGEAVDCKIHTGHTSETYSTLNTTEYSSDISILWLEIDKTRIPHLCNYKFDTFNGNGLCACEFYGSIHENHVHRTANGEEQCPAANKSNYCVCWEPLYGPHNYNILKYNANTHWYECACGKILGGNTSGHSLVYSNSNNITHEESCIEYWQLLMEFPL